MKIQWLERQYLGPVVARSVLPPHRVGAPIQLGDEVVLYVTGAPKDHDVFVRVDTQLSEGKFEGTVSRANRLGAKGDNRLAKGACVSFQDSHVMRVIVNSREDR